MSEREGERERGGGGGGGAHAHTYITEWETCSFYTHREGDICTLSYKHTGMMTYNLPEKC